MRATSTPPAHIEARLESIKLPQDALWPLVLLFRNRSNEPQRRISGAEALAEATRWLSVVSEGERWDFQAGFKSKSAALRSLSRLGDDSEAYAQLRVTPTPGRARSAVLDIYRAARGGPLEVWAGSPSEPCYIRGTLPDELPPDLSYLVFDPMLAHLRAQRRSLSYREDDIHLRYLPPMIDPVRARIKRAYEVASPAVREPLSFDEWCEVQDPRRHHNGRGGRIVSRFHGEFPYDVSVDGSEISQEEREAILGGWIEIASEVGRIEVTLRGSPSEIEGQIDGLADTVQKLTAHTWGVTTILSEVGPPKEAISEIFRDEAAAKHLRTWSFRAHHILWKIPDPSLRTEEGQNAFAVVQESRGSFCELHIAVALDSMDGARFSSVLNGLDGHVPMSLRDEVDWQPMGDLVTSSRGGSLAELQERLRLAARTYLLSAVQGPTSAPLFDPSGKLTRSVEARQSGEVSFKRSVVQAFHAALPEFVFNESVSWTAGGFLEFVRRNSSGTRNILVVSRDKYGGAFSVDAAVSAVPCAEVRLEFAGGDALVNARKRAGWGLRGLLGLLEHGVAGSEWSWVYRDQGSFDRMLSEAVGRVQRVLVPLFSHLEPILAEMRSMARG